MDFIAPHRIRGSHRRGSALILAAIVAMLTMAIAAPAQATPNLAKAWGRNNVGQLGDGTNEGPEKCGTPVEQQACSTLPLDVSGLSGVEAAAGGGNTTANGHSLALLEAGTVISWGANSHGQLGDGTTTSSDLPVTVNAVSGVAALAAGGAHSLALLSNGTVMAWGANGSGQLGDGTNTDSDVPVAVCAVGATSPCSEEAQQLKGVIAIAAGGEHSLALLSSGTVVAWGENEAGELGNGTTTSGNVPVIVCAAGEKAPCAKDLGEVTAVAAGAEHSLALLTSGKVVAWGQNRVGELGDGGTEASDVPVAVSGLTGVAAIAAGEDYGLAVLSSGGGVMAWGRNNVGQLGDGTSVGPETCGTFGSCSKAPVAVTVGPGPTGPPLTDVRAISGGRFHSVALLANGTVKAWGENGFGQLGDATSEGPEHCGPFAQTCSTVPVEVHDVSGAKGIGAGGEHSLALGAPPTVTGVKPRRGPVGGGTMVTITGTDFIGETAVKFGAVTASSVTVNSDTSITATTPAEAAGVVNVTVGNDWGTSSTSRADRFRFTPTVTGVNPTSGPAAGGTSVTVTGTGFATGTTATRFRFGRTLGTSANCTSTTTCTVTSPAHAAGTVDVKAIVNRVASPRNRPGDQFSYS
jgi:alpha-tubulin suppressor-like RCC1 family protein